MVCNDDHSQYRLKSQIFKNKHQLYQVNSPTHHWNDRSIFDIWHKKSQAIFTITINITPVIKWVNLVQIKFAIHSGN